MSAFFSRYGLYLAIAAAVLVLSVGLYFLGKETGHTDAKFEGAKREIELRGDLQGASDNAAVERVKDAVTDQQQRKELDDALQATESSDKQRASRGCVILRQQGRDTSGIPACR